MIWCSTPSQRCIDHCTSLHPIRNSRAWWSSEDNPPVQVWEKWHSIPTGHSSSAPIPLHPARGKKNRAKTIYKSTVKKTTLWKPNMDCWKILYKWCFNWKFPYSWGDFPASHVWLSEGNLTILCCTCESIPAIQTCSPCAVDFSQKSKWRNVLHTRTDIGLKWCKRQICQNSYSQSRSSYV